MSDVDVNPIDIIRRSAEDVGGDKTDLVWKTKLQDFFLEAARGNIPGMSTVNKFGENPDIDTTTDPEDVHDLGDAYVFSATADIDTISSSNINDTMDVVVQGLDINRDEVDVPVTLNGQNKVTLSTTLIRVNRAFNDSNTTILGNVYTYVDTAIVAGVPTDLTQARAQIRDGNNQTLMAIYSVPAGKTAYIYDYYAGISREKTSAATADFSLRIALFEKKFRMRARIGTTSTGTSMWPHKYTFPIEVPEKSDIKIRCEKVGASNTAVMGGFDILLIDN